MTKQHCNEVQALKLILCKFSRCKKLFLTTNVKSNYITVSVKIFAVFAVIKSITVLVAHFSLHKGRKC